MKAISGVAVDIEQLIALRSLAARLRLQPLKWTQASRHGGFQSKLRGRGMDFAEVRNYQAGDDIRHIDWRVTARTGSAHTKLYTEERERPVYFVIDFSPSMFFGTQVAFKAVIAAQVCATLAWTAALQGDRVGTFLVRGDHTSELRPKLGQRGMMPLLSELVRCSRYQPEAMPVDSHAAMTDALAGLRRVCRPGSLIILLSDFTQLDENSRRHLQQLARHQDMMACVIKDPLETQLPPVNCYGISDGDERLQWRCDNDYARQLFQRWQQQELTKITDFLQQQRMNAFTIQTNDDIAAVLSQRFANKRGGAYVS